MARYKRFRGGQKWNEERQKRSHFYRRPSGLKLLELLMALLITALLIALGLPLWMRQSDHARETEGLTTIRLINEAQEAHYTEKEKFADLNHLGLGVQNSENYQYTSVASGSELGAEAISTAVSQGNFKSYAGRVYLILEQGKIQARSLLCEVEPGRAVNLSGITTCADIPPLPK